MKARSVIMLLTSLAVMLGLATTTAAASTAGCTSGAYAVYCGAQVNHDPVPMAFDVSHRRAAAGQAVIAWPDSTSDPATDFFTYKYGGSAAEVFDYAPGGRISNLCVSQPAAYAGLVLRWCNGSKWQQWIPEASSSGYTLTNAATLQIITSFGQGAQLAGVPVPAAVTAAEQWSATA